MKYRMNDQKTYVGSLLTLAWQVMNAQVVEYRLEVSAPESLYGVGCITAAQVR